MTDQYTPTTEEIRRSYVYAESSSFHAIEPDPNDSPLYKECEPPIKVARKRDAEEYRASQDEFDRWYEAEIAAAEQRGAIKALRDAAGAIEKNNIVFDGDHYQPCNSCMSIHMNWLDYRADQEGAQDE